jgi:hypothetical protein
VEGRAAAMRRRAEKKTASDKVEEGAVGNEGRSEEMSSQEDTSAKEIGLPPTTPLLQLPSPSLPPLSLIRSAPPTGKVAGGARGAAEGAGKDAREKEQAAARAGGGKLAAQGVRIVVRDDLSDYHPHLQARRPPPRTPTPVSLCSP